MSGQLIELVIFAGIALYIINKLISTLGTTYEEDPAQKKSFFGENTGNIKDVTSTSSSSSSQAPKASILKPNFSRKNIINLKDAVVKENDQAVKEGLLEVMNKIPSFDIHKFLKAAKTAFKLIITAADKDDESELQELVDKRYISEFRNIAANYGAYIDSEEPKMLISEIYTFGNNVFIKLLFTGENITEKQKNLHEEWTFTKSIISSDLVWYLSNIDRPQ